MSQTEAIKYFPVGSKWMSLKTKEKFIIKENAETQLKYLKKIHCKFVMKTPVKTR
jgi:hypothetical protein